MSKIGVKACALDYKCTVAETFVAENSDSETDTEAYIACAVSLGRVKCGHFNVVYAHPEALLSTQEGKEMMNDDHFKENMACIAIDEAHMILEWQ